MATRLIHHIKNNAIAYVALFFAIGGGGGFAIAATTGTATRLHACAVRKTGVLILRRSCDRAQRPVSLDSGRVTVAGAATPGLGSASAYANIFANDSVDGSANVTVQYTGSGLYKIDLSPSVCPPSGSQPSVEATPNGGNPILGQLAVATVVGTGPDVGVLVGTLSNGTFTAGNSMSGAYVRIDC